MEKIGDREAAAPGSSSSVLSMVVLLVHAWRKWGLRSCGGWWCMGFQLRVLAEGWLQREEGGGYGV